MGSAHRHLLLRLNQRLPYAPGRQAAPPSGACKEGPLRMCQYDEWCPCGGANAASARAVRAFYAETLPQLGWREDADGRYVRDAEMLTIEIAETGNRRLVRFRFVPVRD